jgi:hypothetical protein
MSQPTSTDTSVRDYRGGYGELTAEIRALGLLGTRPGSYAAHFALVFAGLAAVIA